MAEFPEGARRPRKGPVTTAFELGLGLGLYLGLELESGLWVILGVESVGDCPRAERR